MEKERIIKMLIEFTDQYPPLQNNMKEIRYFLLEEFLKTDYTREEFYLALNNLAVGTDIFYLMQKGKDK